MFMTRVGTRTQLKYPTIVLSSNEHEYCDKYKYEYDYPVSIMSTPSQRVLEY